MTVISGQLVLPGEVVPGSLEIDGSRIARITRGGSAPAAGDFGRCLVVPGFIDVHMHGLGRHDVFETSDIVAIARLQPQFGTTGFLPTAASLSADRYLAFGRHVAAARREAGPEAAEILGAHFEGPFVNPAAKGGMVESLLRPVDLDECRRYLHETDGAVRLMTLAPELPGAMELIRFLGSRGVVASIGHSRATSAELDRAVEAGISLVCHLFNTFEREGDDAEWPWRRGLLDAILADRRLAAEVNGDMIHVRPDHVRLAIERFGPDRFVAITDSVPGAGLPPGEYRMIDGRELSNRSGAARLVSNGTLVGSVVTMDRVFANLIEQCGVAPADAARYTSTNAAHVLGVDDRVGSLEVGKIANLAVLDGSYHCVATFVGGRRVSVSGQ